MLLTATWCIAYFLSRLNKLRHSNHVAFQNAGNPAPERGNFGIATCLAETKTGQAEMDFPNDQVVLVSSGILECPLEKDGTLALATLQSQLPCARGLWYNVHDGESRRVIRYNGNTATFGPPKEGWRDQVYYVSFYESNVVCNCSGSWTSLERMSESRRSFNLTSSAKTSHTREGLERDPFRDGGHSQSQTEGYESLHEVSEADTLLTDYADPTPDVMLKRIQSLEALLSAKENEIQSQVCKAVETNNELDKQIKEKNAYIESLTQRCDDLVNELTLLKESTGPGKANGQRAAVPSRTWETEEGRRLIERLQADEMPSSGHDEMNLVDNLVRWITKSQERFSALQERLEEQGFSLNEYDYGDVLECEEMVPRFVQGLRDLQSSCSVLTANLESKDRELHELRLAHLTALEEKVKSQRALESHLDSCNKAVADSKASDGWEELSVLKKMYEEKELLSVELDDKLCERNEQLYATVSRLETAEREKMALTSEVNETKSRCSELEKQLRESNANLEEYGHHLAAAEENIQSLEKRFKEAESRCEVLKAELDQKNNEALDLRNDVRDLQQQRGLIPNGGEDAENGTDEPEVLLRTVKHNETYNNGMQLSDPQLVEQSNYADMKDRCGNLEKMLQEKDAEIRKLHSSLQQLQSNIPSDHPEDGDAQRRIRELEAELESAKSEIRHLTATLEYSEEGSETEMHHDERQHVDVQTSLEEKEIDVAMMQAKMEKLEEEVRFANKRGDEAQSRYDDLEAELLKANNEIGVLRTNLEAAEKKDTTRRCEELEEELEGKQKDINALQSTLEELQDQIRCAQKRGDDAQWRCGELEADLGRARCELDNLRPRLNELEQNNQRLDKSYNDTKWRNGELEAMLGNKDGEICHLKKSLENLQSEKNYLLSEMDKLSSRTSPDYTISQVTREEAYDELSSELYKLHQRKYSLEKEMSEVQMELHSFQQHHLKMMEERKGLEDELSRTRENVGRLEWHSEELEAQKRSLEQQLADKHNEIQYLKGEINRYNSAGQMDSSPAEMASRICYLETELRNTHDRLRDASDKAKWYKGEVDYFRQELSNCHGRIQWLESELNRVHGLLNQQKEAGPVDERWDRLQEERNGLQQEVNALRNQLREEGEKRRWYQGEKEYFSNMSRDLAAQLETARAYPETRSMRPDDGTNWDQLERQLREMTDKAKWYEGEKEHFRNELSNCAQRCHELQRICDQFAHLPDDAFWLQKEPYVDRNRWILCQWSEVRKNPTRRMLFETSSPSAHQIYLCLSCFNWECALLMHRRDDGTWYLWVNVPAGRHEFRFMQDGTWHTNKDDNRCWNDYGSENNWTVVD